MLRKLILMGLCVLFTSVLFYSCKKENTGPSGQPEEAYYKQQLAGLITLKPLTSQQDTINSKPAFRFATYKEAYHFFYTLFKTDAYKKIPQEGVLTASDPITQKSLDDGYLGSETNDGTVYYYGGNLLTTATVPNTAYTTSVGFRYHLRMGIHYSSYYQQFDYIYSNVPSAPQSAYGGLGTVTSRTQSIQANYPSQSTSPSTPASNGGAFNGEIDGTVVVAGTAASFFLYFGGVYRFTMPLNVWPTISVSTYINSFSGGI